MPDAGSFDIRYKASSQIPISKPLEQQKADEMYDRLIKNPTIDPYKLAEYLLKTRELPADEFKLKPPGQEQPEGAQISQMVDLASVENDELIRGKEIPPTPYASVVHTQIHVDYMNSEKFRKDVPVEDIKILQAFTTHVMGEIAAQMARGGGNMTGAGGGVNMPQGGAAGGGQMIPPEAMAMGNVVPGRIEGGGQVPSGMPGSQSGVQVGRKV
jgi:hypothetical protein